MSFQFPGAFIVISFILTFAGALVSGAFIIPALKRHGVGQTIRDDGPSTHLVKAGVPTMGGLIFLIPALVVLGALSFWDRRIIATLIAVAGFGAVGFIDDVIKVRRKNKNGLTPMQKTIGLIIVAFAFSVYAAFSVYIGMSVILPLTGMNAELFLPFWIYIPFTVFVMYSTSNAANLTDGVDGLASSVTMLIMAAFTLGAVLSVREDGAAALTAALAGGCLGFLFFNAHPAKVIMGDCGSLALGGAVSAAAVAMRVHWIILFFGAIYVAEALSVVIQVSVYKRTRRRVFKMAPLHHHFELSGWGENKIVLTFSAVTIIFCIAGMLLLFVKVFP